MTKTDETDPIRHRIMIMSGKGGVGKTTVAVNLALRLVESRKNTGLLDADITGPNIPKMLHIEDELPSADEEMLIPVYLPLGCDHGLSVMSMAFMIEKDAAVPWHGQLRTDFIRQFVEGIRWDWMDALDYLLIDLPPGTGDEPMSIAELMDVDGVIIVTTPQDVALLDTRKAINMARYLEIPVIGIIENMSGFVCPHCGCEIDLFGKGGGERVAKEMGVPFLGSVPLDPLVVRSGDSGIPFVLEINSATARSFEAIVDRMDEVMKGMKSKTPLS
ncbi:MAG: Iron-sulfur cluster carrier protein [Candidatus Methanogaster sp.]|nr:MAG: Iron-sulfur cluster carrier protein [ANME-2 cluster archaeon]